MKSVFILIIMSLFTMGVSADTNQIYISNNDSSAQRKYIGIGEVGFNNIVTRYGDSHFRANVINGIEFEESVSLGLGIGVRVLPGSLKTVLIPLFGDIRFRLMQTPNFPYLSLGGGYSFNATHDFREVGYMLYSTAGVNLVLKNNLKFLIGVGYEYQQGTFQPLKSISMQLGFVF